MRKSSFARIEEDERKLFDQTLLKRNMQDEAQAEKQMPAKTLDWHLLFGLLQQPNHSSRAVRRPR
jgi:hypothetical protein